MISDDRLVNRKRRAEKRSAFRLDIVVHPPPAVATLSLRLSPRLDLEAARLSHAVYHCRLATRRDTLRHPRTDETTNAANPPGAPRERVSPG
jgi:hypothetical protein